MDHTGEQLATGNSSGETHNWKGSHTGEQVARCGWLTVTTTLMRKQGTQTNV